MTSAEQPVLAFESVFKTYPATPPVYALRDANIQILEGNYVAIMGPSGSGKSTLLNLAALIDRPTSGSVLVRGVDVAGLSDRDRTSVRANHLGIVFQAFHLLSNRTALENVSVALVYLGVRRRERARRSLSALQMVGLAHRVHAFPNTLSGGEQQRVAIARALVSRPSLLLMDEPTGDLDSEMTSEILRLLRTLNDGGLTIAVITHDEDVAMQAGRLLLIRDGAIHEPARSAL